MLEYEMVVNIKVENKESLDNLLITVESVNPNVAEPCAIEILNLNITDEKSITYNQSKSKWVQQYELDSWLSPIAT